MYGIILIYEFLISLAFYGILEEVCFAVLKNVYIV